MPKKKKHKLHVKKCKNVARTLDLEVQSEVAEQPSKVNKPIRQISEDLNAREWNFNVYTDTTAFVPGVVVYVIEKIEPSQKTPYVTYRPSARIITGIHDSGVNQGTVFFSYKHTVVVSQNLGLQSDGNKIHQVISEDDVIYSPLTKGHAQHICKLLNLQSRTMYRQYLKQNQKTK